MSLRFGLFLVFTFASAMAFAQAGFVPNEGQWNNAVKYKADISSGHAFLQNDRITYSFYNTAEILRVHEALDTANSSAVRDDLNSTSIACYAYEMVFAGASVPGIYGSDKQKAVVSYFSGNNSDKWRGNLPMYSTLTYAGLYPGIDAVFHLNRSALKYDFVIAPRADASVIQLTYNGQQSLQVRDGALEIGAGFLVVREVIPAAYQIVNGQQKNVRCEYLLEGNTVRFHFPDGYDKELELIIDPELVAATYSGGTCVSFGFTATYDDEGNIYAGGIAFGTGFPVTPGAYDQTYNAMHDICISKYNADATALLYCTYVGGSAEEYPHSMYVHGGNLYVLGSAVSSDFPVTANAYDVSHNGLSDIIVFALNSNGSALVGSTFIGGTSSDGLNVITINTGDNYRGEIVVSAGGDVYIASNTTSTGFPVTSGAYSVTSSGGGEGVVLRMNGALTTLLWATFIGGPLHDAAVGIRVDETGNVFVCGTTRGIFGGFPVTTGAYQTTYSGGASDAFVAKFDPSGSALLACTFYGGQGVDMAYFIDLDSDGDVYICGEATLGAPITPGTYAAPGSTNFIAKLNPSLTTLLFSTIVGDGTSTALVIPSAFMVDKCKRIYLAGFGGSNAWPLTPDALYSWSQESQFYLAAYSENMTDLLFATNYASWHVDGGTSRFDPQGIVYHAVCQGGPGFPTTPGAFSDGATAPDWDVCVFKFDFQIVRGDVLLPNVFTPNNDGINDFYEVDVKEPQRYEIGIYDRWGTQVFYSEDALNHWNGTYAGRPCEEGVYYIHLTFGYCTDEPTVKTGFVHLLRGQ